MKRITVFGLTVCLVALMAVQLVAAQTSRGTFTGTVTDPSGAVVPGATVTLVNKATNLTREGATNQAGIYRFDAVDLGTYDVIVKADGFKEARQTGITVQANRTATLDFTVDLGAGVVTIEVLSSTTEILQTSDAARGGNFEPMRISQLPLPGLDSLNLTLLLPGVQAATTAAFSNGTDISVNGTRARGNNFMIDGVENNDISVAGPAFQITNPDAIQEVAVQTSNFSAEFGRAGGAVVNQITKSGTNDLHGTATWIYLSHVFDATDNGERLGAGPGDKIPPPFVENIPSFTVGGPVYIPKLYDGRNKTFFFAGAQWDRFFASALSGTRRVPTDAGVATLQTLSGACPNVALYLQALGTMRGNPGSSPSNISIAIPAATFAVTGSCNGTDRAGMTVGTGLVSQQASQFAVDKNYTIRLDHAPSQKQSMSFRWLFDSNESGPSFNNLDGFDSAFNGRTMTGSFTDTYIISNSWTNEFRFNYGRIGFNFPSAASDAFHQNLPSYGISGVTGFGVATNIPQFRFANNWQYQDTLTWVRGKHQMRFGVDFLRQLAKQRPPFNERGSFTFNAVTGAAATTGLANFIDDLGGSAGALNRVFGQPVYYPNLFRQSYFFQDNWRVNTALTLNLGLRYENFGQPANVFLIPAFTNYSVTDFATPNEVKQDNNNFGPVVGFAWNPGFRSGFLNTIFGDHKTVWRGGFQVTYDTFFNNLLSNIAGSSPNTLGGNIASNTSAAAPRGLANFSAQFATIQATPPTPLSPQTSLLDPNIRNPYAMRWSLGVQRELPVGIIMDLSYVGTGGRSLFRTRDMNPFVTPTARFNPAVGQRTIRDNGASSTFHSLQLNVRRRYSSTPIGSVQIEGSYTWSHNIDNISEVFATTSTATNLESLPAVLGFSNRVDRGTSDNDRRHRLVLNYVWDIRGPKTGWASYFIGGWTLGGVSQFVTGAPFTVRNGTDRNGDGQGVPDRPEIGNVNAPINSRAQINTTTCAATGFINPESGACVTPNDVFWVQAAANTLPGANTAGRNIAVGRGFIRWDLNVIKRFNITERMKFEYRAEMFNLFNRQNFGIPGFSVGTTVAGSFFAFDETEAVGRSMRMGLKLIF
jgi:hypothetical protein